MSSISVSRRHNMTTEDVRAMVLQLAKKLNDRYELKSRWQGDNVLELYRQGVKGQLRIDPQLVKIDIKLGLMMAPFKSVIKEELERAMREKLV